MKRFVRKLLKKRLLEIPGVVKFVHCPLFFPPIEQFYTNFSSSLKDLTKCVVVCVGELNTEGSLIEASIHHINNDSFFCLNLTSFKEVTINLIITPSLSSLVV